MSYELSVISYQLSVIGYQLLVIGEWFPEAEISLQSISLKDLIGNWSLDNWL